MTTTPTPTPTPTPTAATETLVSAENAAMVTDLSRFKAYGNWADIETRLVHELNWLLGEMPTLRQAHDRQLCHLRIIAISEAIRDGNYGQL